jgi:hypothetical protein
MASGVTRGLLGAGERRAGALSTGGHRCRRLPARVGVTVLGLVTALWSATALAQPSKDQRTCITTLNGDGAKVAKQQGKANRHCLKDAGNGDLPATAQACVAQHGYDKLDAAFTKATNKTTSDHTEKCVSPLPDFAYAGATAVNAAALHRENTLLGDVFGADLDAAVVSCNADEPKCKCQRAVLGKTEGLAAAMHGIFAKCKKSILATAMSASDVSKCLTDPATAGSVAASSASGEKLDKLIVKLGETITKACDTPGVTSGAFPGKCSALSGTSLRDCLTRQVKCRVCRSINDMDSLGKISGPGVSCDAFDDGGTNNSCAEISTIDSAGYFYYSSIGVPSGGAPVMSYYDNLNGALKVAKCGNPSCSFLATVNTVDTSGDVGLYTSLAVPADGLPVISYFDQSNGDLKVAKCGDASCSTATISTVDGADYVGYYTSIAVPADGLPVISYWDATNSDLKVAKCADASCTSASAIVVLDPFGASSTSIAVPNDGLPVVAWSTGMNLYVAKCGNADCTAGNTITPVGIGVNPSLFVPADNRPIVAYASTLQLSVLKCGDAACTSGNVATLVDSALIGSDLSICVSPTDGLPVVAYPTYYSPQELRVAKCADAACSSPATITTVDPIAPTGTYPSLFVPADGLPVISYSGNSAQSLRVLKCANGSCS